MRSLDEYKIYNSPMVNPVVYNMPSVNYFPNVNYPTASTTISQHQTQSLYLNGANTPYYSMTNAPTIPIQNLNRWNKYNRALYTPYPISVAESSFNNLHQNKTQYANKSASYIDSSNIIPDLTQQQQQQSNNFQVPLTYYSAPYPISEYENRLLNSKVPIELPEDAENIEVLGQRGLWANKFESVNWNGDLPIADYKLNEDSNPEYIVKPASKKIDYVQECAIRYLRPPTPPPPGEIIIKQEKNIQTLPAPPLIIRQQPERIKTPEPIVIREAPPTPPKPIGRKLIIISGKKLPPPPRKVIIERLPSFPAKPPQVLIERWLPYENIKRKVIYQPASPTPPLKKPKNLIVQWDSPEIEIEKDVKYLGVFKTDPDEYIQKYESEIRETADLPDIVNQIQTPKGIILAADLKKENDSSYSSNYPELEGNIDALNLIDLKKEGLSQYSHIIISHNILNEKTIISREMLPIAELSESSHVEILSSSSLSTTTIALQKETIDQDFQNNELRSSTPHYSQLSNKTLLPDIDTEKLISLVFQTIDTNNKGVITIEDAKNVFNKLNSRFNRNYDSNDVARFFNVLDSKNNFMLSFDEFKSAFMENFFID